MRRKTHFQCTMMRGGTSKGIFLMEEDLPQDPSIRDRIIMAIFGSPDLRQIDGLGGADSLTSKLALISPSQEPDRDINYTFGAVGIDKPFVDYSANCGNISSAVGPYAVDRGLVKAEEPFTIVRIYNTNTKKMIYSKVPVKKGKVVSDGNYAIDGVPGTGAKIELSFMDPGGATTGKLSSHRKCGGRDQTGDGREVPRDDRRRGQSNRLCPGRRAGAQGDGAPGRVRSGWGHQGEAGSHPEEGGGADGNPGKPVHP